MLLQYAHTGLAVLTGDGVHPRRHRQYQGIAVDLASWMVQADTHLRTPIHASRRYRPTGPALLSGIDMAAAVQNAVGHAVLPVTLPFWMFRKAALLRRARRIAAAVLDAGRRG